MKNSLGIIFLAAFFATGFCVSSAFAQTHSTDSTSSQQASSLLGPEGPSGPRTAGQAATSTNLSSLILELQTQIKALQMRINELETELGVKPPQTEALALPASGLSSVPALPTFTTTLSLGSHGDDVRNLQTFLAQFIDIYPEGLVTSYYGPLTEKAVQRWQEKEGIVSSGTSETTGYGRIGPKTRARLNDVAVKSPHKKVIVCHIPSDNRENKQTLEIAEPALKAHLAHGDYEGACVIAPPLSTATSTPPQTGTTTPLIIPTPVATTTPSGTITATPAQPIGQTGTTTVPATPAQPTTGTPPPPPPPGGTIPPPSPTPSPTPPPPSSGDTSAPAISNVQATNVTTSEATITWTTDESADGKVEYGLTASYGSSFASTTFVTSQSIRISSLQAGTLYHYRVISKDMAGNAATSGDYMFTTLFATPPPAPTGGPNAGGFVSAGWPIGSFQQIVSFYYDAAAIYQIKSFRFYQKRPGETSFTLLDTFNNPATLISSCNDNINIRGSSRILVYRGCPSSQVQDYWEIDMQALYPASYYPVGTYEFYVTAVNGEGTEGVPSPTQKIVLLTPTEIISPTTSQSPVSATPTFQWTGSDYTNLTYANVSYITLYTDSILTSYNYSYQIYEKSVGAGKTIQTYDGPALDPTKKYVLKISAPSIITPTTSGAITTVSLLKKVEKFWVSAPTIASATNNASLANILQSLSAALDDIQKQIQKLR